ncbi:hypothetical protein M434DRAFT_31685 [Hypoxylon sp. CO27-5]|nr:hypothetical protein M434DRAFT_31685 [Hypoxylon sp. CO27-5]
MASKSEYIGKLKEAQLDSVDVSFDAESLRETPLLAGQNARLKPTWVRNLPEIFTICGFVDVEQNAKDAPPHLDFTSNEQMARGLKRLVPSVADETEYGAYCASLRYTIIGRKL